MDIASLKVADLKKELAARDLNTNGLKAELAARLQEALEADGKGEDKSGDAAHVEDVEDVDIAAPEVETEVDLGIEKEQSPVESREAADAVEADAIADNVRAGENTADEKHDAEPSVFGAIHDAHAAGVEAVQVDASADTVEDKPNLEPSPEPSIPKSAKPLARLETPHPPTRALKVLHLVRPILSTTLREEAEKFGTLEEGAEYRQGIFLDGIKSAGWIVYKDTASAVALFDAFNGKPFPNTDATFRGSVFFYYVPPEVVPRFIAEEEALWEKDQGRLQILADVQQSERGESQVKYEYYSRPLKKGLGKEKKTEGSTTSSVTGGSQKSKKAKPTREFPAAAGVPPRPSSRIRGLASHRPAQDASHLPPVVFPPARDTGARYHPYASREPVEPRRSAPLSTSSVYAKDIDYPIHPRTGNGGDSYQRERLPPPRGGYDDYGYDRPAYRSSGYDRPAREYERPPPRDIGPERYPEREREYPGRGGYDAGYDRYRERERDRDFAQARPRDNRQRSPVSYSRSRDDRYERR